MKISDESFRKHKNSIKENIKKTLGVLELFQWFNFDDDTEYQTIYSDFLKTAPEIIIFIHWITYVNDRNKKIKINVTWLKWVKFFGRIIQFYIQNSFTYESFEKFKKKFDDQATILKSNFQIYPQDWGNLIYTLWILGKFFEKDLVKIIDKLFEISEDLKFEDYDNQLTLVAYVLSLLGYSVIEKDGSYLIENFKEITNYFERLNNLKKAKNVNEAVLNLKSWQNWRKNKRYRSQ